MKILSPFFYKRFNNFFFINLFYKSFSYIYKYLKLYQLNIIKKIKKEYKKRARERYQYLPKKKKWQYGRERCKNLSEDDKQKLFEYRKKT